MALVELKVETKYLVAAGVVALILGVSTWKYMSIQSQLNKALVANTDYEKRLAVCSSNYTGVDNSLSNLMKQIEDLEAANKVQVDKVKLSEQKVTLIRQNYDKLIQQVDKAPAECKAAMQWLRDQSRK